MTLLRKLGLALLLILASALPAAAAQRQIIGGTTTIVFTPEFLAFYDQFGVGGSPVSAFGTATQPDAATIVLPMAAGPYFNGIGYLDSNAGYLVYQHGGAGFTLAAEGIAYLFDPFIALGNLSASPFDEGPGSGFLAAGIAAGDGSVIPAGPDITMPIFTIPPDEVVATRVGSHFILSNIRLSFYGAGTLSDLGTVAIATSEFDFNAIPEPATWGLMIAGFGLTGIALRRRQPKRTLPGETLTATS